MRESGIEAYLKKRVEEAGGMCMKFISPGNNGVPDRIILHPGLSKPTFVETKAPGESARKLQLAVHRRMRKYGAEVCILDDKVKIDAFLKEKGLQSDKTGKEAKTIWTMKT